MVGKTKQEIGIYVRCYSFKNDNLRYKKVVARWGIDHFGAYL